MELWSRILLLATPLVLVSQSAWSMSISDAKLLPDGQPVTLAQKVVTYSATGYFYIEEDARNIGIRVEKAGHGLAVGMRADVSGVMKTNTNGERYILASTAVQSPEPNDEGTIAPVGMNNLALGGADWLIVGTGGQHGVAEAVGLNNIGLLVKTWGKYQQSDATTFTIDDGTRYFVKCTVPSGTFLYSGWQYVVATGISSLYKLSQYPYPSVYPPNILVRDIEVLAPVEAVSIPGIPTGDGSPLVNTVCTYSTTGSTCNWGHPVEYSFTWGDGASSPWSASTSASHSWSAAGPSTITVTARCQNHPGVSAVSPGLTVNATQVNPGEMVYIPAGSFLMGNNGQEPYSHANELPQHSVYLSGYWIGKYEVTRGEYRQFIDAGGYSNSAYWSTNGWSWKVANNRTQPDYWDAEQHWGDPPGTFTQTDYHPVVGVTYYESEAFGKWAGGQLPTEAQWEKAARWTGSHPNVWPWGDAWDDEKCNGWTDSLHPGSQTAHVGSYPSGVSPYGCHDMAGNVWEWCKDWYKSNYYSPPPPGGWVDPQGPATGSYRILRGDSWSIYDNVIGRCAYRNGYAPNTCSYNRGFRFARFAPRYQLVDIGAALGGDTSWPTGINSSGWVVGYWQTPDYKTHAFVWRDGLVTDLGNLGGKHTQANGVNDAGVVVGQATDSAGLGYAFAWDSINGIRDIGTLSLAYGGADGINNLGHVAAHMRTVEEREAGIPFHAYTRDENGVWSKLSTPYGGDSTAYSINDEGQVAGAATVGIDVQGVIYHACLWHDGSFLDLGTLGGRSSGGMGINNAGQVVGQADNGSGVARAFLWDTVSGMRDLGTLGATWSVAYDVNNLGQVVGRSAKVNENADLERAFLWENGVMQDLNNEVALPADWVLDRATAINDCGQIVGCARYNGSDRAFLLTPLPHP